MLGGLEVCFYVVFEQIQSLRCVFYYVFAHIQGLGDFPARRTFPTDLITKFGLGEGGSRGRR